MQKLYFTIANKNEIHDPELLDEARKRKQKRKAYKFAAKYDEKGDDDAVLDLDKKPDDEKNVDDISLDMPNEPVMSSEPEVSSEMEPSETPPEIDMQGSTDIVGPQADEGEPKKDIAQAKRDGEIEDPAPQLNNAEIPQQLLDFIKTNPFPKDEQLHAFAESLKIEPKELENYAYAFLSMLFADDASEGEVLNKEQLDKGMDVEREHIAKPVGNPVLTIIGDLITKKIASDHILESEKYYNELEKMEAGMSGEKEKIVDSEIKEVAVDDPRMLTKVHDPADDEAVKRESVEKHYFTRSNAARYRFQVR